MRRKVSIALALSAVLLVCSSPGVAAKCPARAIDASFAIWPVNSLRVAQTVSAMHPCGRRITCVSGVRANKFPRRCRWG